MTRHKASARRSKPAPARSSIYTMLDAGLAYYDHRGRFRPGRGPRAVSIEDAE